MLTTRLAVSRSMMIPLMLAGAVVPRLARGQTASAAAPAGSGSVSASVPDPARATSAETPASAPDAATIHRLEQRIADLEAHAAAAKTSDDKKPDAPATDAGPKDGAPKVVDPKDAEPKAADPFAFADFSWAPSNYGSSDRPLSWGPFTGEIRVDFAYHYDFSNPKDHTISGSSEVFRSNEFQLAQMGFGGDFLYKNVQARVMTQFGMYSETTPRNDASPGLGQWNLADAYRYLSEAYGGYHIDALNGVNIQGGIFMSYVGLWSYYNFDNWTYQPSYVSSNTPWFFNGMRAQIFVSDKLKIEPWLVNGWQSYGKFNEAPGVGLQTLWKPNGWITVLGNQYFGTDTLGTPGRKRVHTDDSIMFKLYENQLGFVSKVAVSLTVDAGCEFGNGSTTAGTSPVACGGGSAARPNQYFLGFMSYARVWYLKNKFATTFGGGAITNPGRYLVLLPPINGATASTGSPYFTENPGDKYQAWDMQITGDYMPREFITFRLEYNHRAASVPYFTGSNGVTPPGGNNGSPGTAISGWSPDLVKTEDRITFAMLVKF